MKTKMLVTLLVVLFSSVSLFAKEKEVITYLNVDKSARGITKEYTIVDKETLGAQRKVVYVYDKERNLQEKTIYAWNNKSGWVGLSKTEYEYTANNQIVNLSYTKWDSEINNWSDQKEVMAYIYDHNNKLLTSQN